MAAIQSGVPWTSGTDDNTTTLAAANAAMEDSVGGLTPEELDALASDSELAAAIAGIDLSAYIAKSTLDANSILYATADNTPIPLLVSASRIVGRKSSGNIDDMTTAELAALFGTPDGTKFLKDDGTLATPGGDPWTLIVDESGASVANWTSVAGTWSADAGGFIKQTDGTGATRGLRLTAAVHAGAGLVAQADVRFPTEADTIRRALLGLVGTAALSSTTDMWAGLNEGDNDGVITMRGDSGNTLSTALTVAEDTWYTIGVTLVDGICTVWVDGTPQQTSRVDYGGGTTPVHVDKFMLVAYGGQVDFRNIKVWRLDTPLA